MGKGSWGLGAGGKFVIYNKSVANINNKWLSSDNGRATTKPPRQLQMGRQIQIHTETETDTATDRGRYRYRYTEWNAPKQLWVTQCLSLCLPVSLFALGQFNGHNFVGLVVAVVMLVLLLLFLLLLPGSLCRVVCDTKSNLVTWKHVKMKRMTCEQVNKRTHTHTRVCMCLSVCLPL